MGKRKKIKKRTPGLTRKQRSRLDYEERMKNLLTWGVVAVGVAVVGVLAYGLIFEGVVKARRPVAVVGDEPIKTSEFQARVRFARMQLQNQLSYLYQQQSNIDANQEGSDFYLEYIQGQISDIQSNLSPENANAIGEQALNQLIQEELVRQEANSRGISVTSAEVQEQIESSFGYNPEATDPEPTALPPLTETNELTAEGEAVMPTPTQMSQEDFQQLYNNYLREGMKPLGISEKMYRSWVESSLLIEKLQEQMTEELPDEIEQVKLRLLSVDNEEQASELTSRLEAGEDFQTLSSELEEAEESTGYGTELDWYPRDILESQLGPDIAETAFSLEVGEHSQPLPQQTGQGEPRYIVIEVVGHEMHEMSENVRQQKGEQAFQEWLDAQQVLVERRSYQDIIPMEP